MVADISKHIETVYDLFAIINHHGESRETGHYTCALFECGHVIEYNDDKVKGLRQKVNAHTYLQDPIVQSTTYLIFYKKVFVESDALIMRPSWVCNNNVMVEKLWFGEAEIPMCCSINHDDLLTLVYGNEINGDIIDAFISVISKRTKIPLIKILDSNIFTSLNAGRPTLALKNLLEAKEDIEKAHLILVPVNHKNIHGVGVHWSLIAIILRQKTIIHFDSAHRLDTNVFSVIYSLLKGLIPNIGSAREWNYISPLNVSKQQNNYDCGVFVCVFAHCLLTRETIITESIDSSSIRYWIAELVTTSREVKQKLGRERRAFPVEHSLIKPDMVQRKLSSDVQCFLRELGKIPDLFNSEICLDAESTTEQYNDEELPPAPLSTSTTPSCASILKAENEAIDYDENQIVQKEERLLTMKLEFERYLNDSLKRKLDMLKKDDTSEYTYLQSYVKAPSTTATTALNQFESISKWFGAAELLDMAREKSCDVFVENISYLLPHFTTRRLWDEVIPAWIVIEFYKVCPAYKHNMQRPMGISSS